MLGKLAVLAALIGGLYLIIKLHTRITTRRKARDEATAQITELEQDPDTGHYKIKPKDKSAD